LRLHLAVTGLAEVFSVSRFLFSKIHKKKVYPTYFVLSFSPEIASEHDHRDDEEQEYKDQRILLHILLGLDRKRRPDPIENSVLSISILQVTLNVVDRAHFFGLVFTLFFEKKQENQRTKHFFYFYLLYFKSF
jgi:hypothetical protein